MNQLVSWSVGDFLISKLWNGKFCEVHRQRNNWSKRHKRFESFLPFFALQESQYILFFELPLLICAILASKIINTWKIIPNIEKGTQDPNGMNIAACIPSNLIVKKSMKC